jgi:hypothetical protein
MGVYVRVHFAGVRLPAEDSPEQRIVRASGPEALVEALVETDLRAAASPTVRPRGR